MFTLSFNVKRAETEPLLLTISEGLSITQDPTEAMGEPPLTEWDKTYGGGLGDFAYAVVQTGDGGYALAGYTYSFGAGNGDFYLVKTDSAGNQLWDNTYGGTGEDRAYGLVQTSDGGYALAGLT